MHNPHQKRDNAGWGSTCPLWKPRCSFGANCNSSWGERVNRNQQLAPKLDNASKSHQKVQNYGLFHSLSYMLLPCSASLASPSLTGIKVCSKFRWRTTSLASQTPVSEYCFFNTIQILNITWTASFTAGQLL